MSDAESLHDTTVFPTPVPSARRVLITSDPFQGVVPENAWHASVWPGSWVWLEGGDARLPVVAAFRCAFDTASAAAVRLHVSADERYELFLDGERLGRGPERGDPEHWAFDTYEVDLEPGDHVLVARVWSLGEAGYQTQGAAMSVRPGLLVAAEGEWAERLSTQPGKWWGKPLDGYTHLPAVMEESAKYVGGSERVDGRLFDWGFERGEGDGWGEVVRVEAAQCGRFNYGERYRRHRLTPAQLPPRGKSATRFAEVRFAAALPNEFADDPLRLKVTMDDHVGASAAAWQALIEQDQAVVVPPHSAVRVILDARDYFTGYPELTVSGGAGASVRWHWAEALFNSPDPPASGDAGAAVAKGHRDELDGKYFRGRGDTFITDGGEGRLFSPLWWRAGRYAELLVNTGDTPLRIESLIIRQTYYPLEDVWSWQSSESRLDATLPILRRGMRACMHEHYTDCPYYEQLMYTGDTRIEVLTNYLLSPDTRLARKAVELFSWSGLHDGFTQARYPCYDTQVIAPFSLWWVAMVHDAARWRGDLALVRRVMPAVRGVLEAWRACRNADGLAECPDGWNFVDWVPGWRFGCPPGSFDGVNITMNWHFAWALRIKANLERFVDEPELATRDERDARAAADALLHAAWDDDKALFVETPGGDVYSEHAQCLAQLSGLLDESQRRRCLAALLKTPGLARTTIYFSFYLLETLGLSGEADPFFRRLEQWYGLPEQGFVCPPESPEPSRSDCHAWGSHPMFHLYATVLGLRPKAFGMDELVIRPMLGPLQHIAGRCAHPRGRVSFDLRRDADGRLSGEVALPAEVNAKVMINGQTYQGRGTLTW